MTHPITNELESERNTLLSDLHQHESLYGYARRTQDWVAAKHHVEKVGHILRLLDLNQRQTDDEPNEKPDC